MPSTMKLKDGKIKNLFSERDFTYLVGNYKDYEAADYFCNLMEELEQYREEDEEYE